MGKGYLQADLNQRKEGEKSTFPVASGQCIEHSAAAAALLTSGTLAIATWRCESSAFALHAAFRHLAGSQSDKEVTMESRVCHPLDSLLNLFSRID